VKTSTSYPGSVSFPLSSIGRLLSSVNLRGVCSSYFFNPSWMEVTVSGASCSSPLVPGVALAQLDCAGDTKLTCRSTSM
jgi:hypothetical protein